jgi:hypothetical protein
VTRFLAAVVLLTATLSGGCASTWDKVSSRRFRDKPFDMMFKSEPDALATLRTLSPAEGDERARAFKRLQEPATQGRANEQDEALQLLADAASHDPSAYVRVCAIDALGRFQDPRVAEQLVSAYRYAPGKPVPTTGTPAGESGVVPASGEVPAGIDLAAMFGTKGFAADQVANIRCRAIEGLAASGRPEAVPFLAAVARGDEFGGNEDAAGRDYARQRAVDGLGKLRTKESVVALQKVLAAEHDRDVALTSLAHAGLKDLTGKALPADPAEWGKVVQAGFEVAPAKSGVERAVAEIID